MNVKAFLKEITSVIETQSLNMAIGLSGWAILLVYLAYEYAEMGSFDGLLAHISTTEPRIFLLYHMMIFLAPVVSTALAYLAGKRQRAEEKLREYARELEESNKMKDLFTDILRHDLINPLGNALNFVSLAEGVEEDEEKRELLEKIENNVYKAQCIVEDATNLAMLEHIDDMDMKGVDLNAVVQRTIEELSNQAHRAGVKIENRLDKNLYIRGNEVVETVFVNLINNAVKYAREGKKIVIDSESAGGFWRVKVRDFGEGVEDRYKEQIFDRFSKRKKEGVRGTGLGLANAKRIVELHSGKIWVEDSPNGGATFVVELPKYEAEGVVQ